MYRIKFDFDSKTVSSSKAIELSNVLRVEYGSFKASKTSLTTWVWKKEIEQQQVHTQNPEPEAPQNETRNQKPSTRIPKPDPGRPRR